MKDLFGNETDLSQLIGELKEEWKNLGYEIEYQDFPACTKVLEFKNEDKEKYIQFRIDNSLRITVDTFENFFTEWQQFTSYEIRLILRTIEFLEEHI